MEKKEITLLDLVKIAARWIWVLILGAVVCAGVAFFYSTEMVTPLYSVTSKFVIQTKDQSSNSDILESQRTVAYAQLAVGTYIDIVDTRDFAKEISNYMNGDVKPQKMTQNAINALICQGILADGGIFDTITDENGNTVPSHLKNHIILLCDAGLIPEGCRDMKVYDVVHDRMLKNSEASLKAQGYTTESQKAEIIDKRLADVENLVNDMVADGDFLKADIYTGDTDEKIALLDSILYEDFDGVAQYGADGERMSYNGIEYSAGLIRGKMSFSAPEEDSTTFDITITSSDADEAYVIARIAETVIGDYVEERFPGIGMISTIDGARRNNAPINNNTVLMTLIGFVGGFLLAFVFVYIIELSDNRIKNENELSEKTGLSVVGIIPDMLNDKANSGYYYYSYERREK